ncbi:helix-turn-helix domain-containing protein [Oscillospiraceae bacterium NTUH-002-81]|mgnify:FL=1|nr:helix-turn-helix domain-containing protein [Oscillospiraceae bacterium NTUH-002-81]
MEVGHQDEFIPIQRCYPDEYEEYQVSGHCWNDGFLPVQMFRIRFRKRTGMVLYPHACTLLYFERGADGTVRIRLVGRVTETMCTRQEPGTTYLMLRFPPQYTFEAFKGQTNTEHYLEPSVFGDLTPIRQAMDTKDADAAFALLMQAVLGSSLDFRENKLVDEFVFGSLYNEDNLSIEEIIGNMSYSPRYIRSVIKAQTGINAKRLYDILRLQNIMESQIFEDEDSLNCVYDFGFYDQAHLNKNIRKLTGLSYTSFKEILKEKNQVEEKDTNKIITGENV